MKGKLFIALRLFSNRMDRRYIPIVNWVSSFAIAIGLASILIVISVMNGFEEEIYKNILKSQPHLVLKNTSDDGSDELRCKDFDLSNLVGCKSFSQMNAVVESDSVIQAIVIRSYDDSGTPSIAIGADEIMIDASLASHLGIGYQDPLSISIPVVKNNTLSLIKGGSFRVSDIQTTQEIKSSSQEIIMNSMAFKKFTSEKGAEHNLILICNQTDWINQLIFQD